jgi:hypothetical protein
MSEYFNLDDLLVDLSSVDESQLEDYARNLYRELYITSGKYGIHKCHDGQEVKFWDNRFDHAFFTPKNWHYTTEKQVLDKRRVERLRWIGALISGDVPNSACWLVTQNLVKRLYTIAPKGYLVWLELHREGFWTFSTSYTADSGEIHRKTRGQKRIWKK